MENCKTCQEIKKGMKRVLLETKHTIVSIPQEPHIDRQDGGHIMVIFKRHICGCWEMNREEREEYFNVGVLTAKAMIEVLPKAEHINVQENGNWSLNALRGPHVHLHLYGRSRDSQQQIWGEALSFPKRDSKFYFEALNQEEEKQIRKYLQANMVF